MSQRSMTGTRVRNRRLDRGLRQSDVAKQVGISGSYLNLIEHNRRPVGAKLLMDLARVLEIDAPLLEHDTAQSVLAPLQQAAAARQIDVEDSRAGEMVARFPEFAALIGAQHARILQLEERTDALSNRLAHDTQIAASLHEVISTATAIRSTASILAEQPDLEADWRDRFHHNIDTESARLAESSQALLGFLDMEMEGGGGQIASPFEQAEAVMARTGFYLPTAEQGARAAFDDEPDPATRAVLQDWSQTAVRDAAVLPLDAFLQAARSVAFDPARLATRFNVGLDVVLRRLAHLPPGCDAPLTGLAVCDAAGVVTFQKPVLDFRLPRAGAACPLWPLYLSLSQPGRALRRVVRLPGSARTPFECFAIATPQGGVTFGEEQRIKATMLVRPARTDETPATVGPGCRVCTATDCASRRHPGLS